MLEDETWIVARMLFLELYLLVPAEDEDVLRLYPRGPAVFIFAR